MRKGRRRFLLTIAAARLGAEVAFLGKIASDFLGEKLYGRLAGNGVRTELIRRAPQPVTLAFVERSPTGENNYAFYAENAADRSLLPTDLPASLPASAHFLLAGSISMVLEPAVRILAARLRRLLDAAEAAAEAAVAREPEPAVAMAAEPPPAELRQDDAA